MGQPGQTLQVSRWLELRTYLIVEPGALSKVDLGSGPRQTFSERRA